MPDPQPLTTTPQEDDFYMPAEFATHTACWMLWPQRPDVWRDRARPAQTAFVEVATAISQFEPVIMGVTAAQFDQARAALPDQVQLIHLENNDSWMRDIGPTFVISKDERELRMVDWQFNAWGGLYDDFSADEKVPTNMLAHVPCERYRPSIIMEGGALHVDGEGTLLVTAQCLLNPNRNPHLSQDQIESELKKYLNVQKVLWLHDGVFNDETSGHVDNLCCFIRPGVVALTWTDDVADPQYAISRDAYDRLTQMTDARGRQLEIHTIHQPTPMYMTETEAAGMQDDEYSLPREAGERLAGSYINFYIANGGIIVPQFNDKHDAAACQKLQELFPEHKIVGIYAREILLGGGNIHCITQQQPAIKNG